MDIFRNFDLLSVGLVMAATGILGYIAYFNDTKSVTNRYFLFFSLAAMSWSVFNYLSYQIWDAHTALWLLRIVIFLAVWLCYYLYRLLIVFPDAASPSDDIRVKWFAYALAWLTSLLTLSPFVFKSVEVFSSEGRVSYTQNGPGIYVFGIVVICLVAAGITVLVRKARAASGELKHQIKTTLSGIIVTFTLLIIFNFLLPAFLNSARYIPYGGVFMFPFLAAVTWAIYRHRLMNIKLVSTEILTFVLSIAMLLETVVSGDVLSLMFRVSLFLLVLSVGILLIKSVLKEVRQREQLETLTRKLEDVNEKLQALDKVRSEFISMVSHQLRTPPTTIKWYIAGILAGDFGPISEDVREGLIKAQMTNNSQISLIEDLLNVSRIEHGTMEFVFSPTNLDRLIDITVQELTPAAMMKGLKLVYKRPKKRVPDISADKEKIRQVINNLIDNAIKYTKEGFVSVTLSQEGDNIQVAVTDTGKGIKPEDKERLFKRFSRSSDSGQYAAGLGLGMFVAKIILSQHHGQIRAESQGVDKGSTFYFTVPLHANLGANAVYDLKKGVH